VIVIVSNSATKPQIKKAAEEAFAIKVVNVRVMHTMKGLKKAYVKLHPDTPAADVTTKLGMV